VNAQSQQATEHQEKLKVGYFCSLVETMLNDTFQQLKTRVEALSQCHSTSNASRLNRASTQQIQLTHRLLKLIQHLHLLIPAVRSSAIRPEEEALRGMLEEIDEVVRGRGGGMGRMRGKVNELWAVIGVLGRGKRDGGTARTSAGTDAGVEWSVVDEEGLSQIAHVGAFMISLNALLTIGAF
jgi:nuclear pore complex protein Nup54